MHRPPGWRPPYFPPPYIRPPHWRWGRYYWHPGWGWYFTAAVGAATLVYVATLPDNRGCEEVRFEGETLILCDGVLYRPFRFADDWVYEIVSEAGQVGDGITAPAAPAPPPAPTAPSPGAPSSGGRVDREGFRWD